MIISIVAAMTDKGVIGGNNSLLWNIPEDLKHFKQLTLNKPIIMGRKTYESLPDVLPNRPHLVLTSQYIHCPPNVYTMSNAYEAVEFAGRFSEEVFVVGGAQVYEEFLPFADVLYLTKVHQEFEGDTFFPSLCDDWESVSVMHCFSTIPCDFHVYMRKSF